MATFRYFSEYTGSSRRLGPLTVVLLFLSFFLSFLFFNPSSEAASKKKRAPEDQGHIQDHDSSTDCMPAHHEPKVHLSDLEHVAKNYWTPENNLDANSSNCVPSKKYKMNFGVVVYNDYFKVYRSTGLNFGGLREYAKHLKSHKLPLPKRIIYLHHQNYNNPVNLVYHAKNLYWKMVGKLYGGNFAADEVEASYAMQRKECSAPNSNSCPKKYAGLFPFTFVHPKGEQDKETFVRALEAKCNPFEKNAGTLSSCKCDRKKNPNCKDVSKVTADETQGALTGLLRQLLTKEGPLEVHCQGGLHRTGIAALMLRYLQGGIWTSPFSKPIEKKTSMKLTINGRERVQPVTAKLYNLADHEYYAHNHRDFRQGNLDTVKSFAETAVFKCLKEKFGPYLNAYPNSDPANTAHCYPWGSFEFMTSGHPLTPASEFTEQRRTEIFESCLNPPADHPH